VAGAGSISFSGGTIAAGGSCTVTVDVTVPAAGSYANTSGNVSHVINAATVNGNTASDTLEVEDPVPGLAFLKQVGPTASGPWSSFLAVATGGDVFYLLTLENVGDVPLSPVSVTDPDVNTAGCSWPASLPVASPSNDDHIATCVVGPVTALSGSHTNTATGHGTFGGTDYTDSDSATYATTELTLVKTAAEATFTAAGNVLNYSYLVTNSGFAPLAGPVTVNDDRASDESCPDVSTVGDFDAFLDPGESITCTATYTVTAGDVSALSVTNTASASADGVTSNADSETVTYLAPPTVTKVFVDNPIDAGATSLLVITLNNPGGTALTNVSFTDTYPAEIVNAASPNPSTTCPGGTVSATAGGGTVSLSGASIAANSACTVRVTVTSSVAGSHVNTIPVGGVTTDQSVSNTAAASDTLIVNVPTDTPTTTPSDTAAASDTPSPTASDTPSPTASDTSSPTPSDTPSPTASDTPSPTASDTPSPTASETQSPTASDTPSPTASDTPSPTASETPSPTPSETASPTLTDTPTATSTSTATATATETPTQTPTSTPTGAAQVVDPAVTKSGDPSTAAIGDTIVFTLVITNNGNVVATNVRVVDPIPSFLTVTNVVSSPAATADNSVGNTVDLLYATVTPTDVYTVTITTVVNSSATPPGGPNTATLTADADDDPTNNTDSTTIAIIVGGLGAPETGFAPGRITGLPRQPADEAYLEYGALQLEIPALGLETDIVGVPQAGGSWGVAWLGGQAGYLNGTAFPTWKGNSVITAHVTLASGEEGPFADLKSLRFGDQVIVHAWGLRHVYEIRDVDLVSPSDRQIFRHEERSWLTLVTCHGYDEREASYRWRVAARAVLVTIEAEESPSGSGVLVDKVSDSLSRSPGLPGGH